MVNQVFGKFGEAFGVAETQIKGLPNLKISDINIPGLKMPNVPSTKINFCTTDDFEELKGAVEQIHAEMIANLDALKVQRDDEAAETGTVREETANREKMEILEEKNKHSEIRIQELRACLDAKRQSNEELKDANELLQRRLKTSAPETEVWKKETRERRARIQNQENST